MEFTLRRVGVVRNGRHDDADHDWGALESTIQLDAEFTHAADGLDAWSHAIVLFWMDRDSGGEAPPADWRRHPRGRTDLPRLGVFAQRGRMRPNVIGSTAVPIVRVEPGRVVVRGLDTLDGTPVLDVKPYAPVFDRVDDARVPEWFDAMMRGYFGHGR